MPDITCRRPNMFGHPTALFGLKGKVLVVTLVTLVFRRKSVIWEL